MGVYVTVERWGKYKPVMNVVKITAEDGIEIKMKVEDFIAQVVEEVGYKVVLTMTPAALEKRLVDSAVTVVNKLKDSTVGIADLVH